ncbi:MAG: 23S rRNA (guanosine2251-2'-O)-methyltransferase [Flavobacteriales bacterium]|jgi:23S rRNA (guanosine2251-2'-O)-methyltransferase
MNKKLKLEELGRLGPEEYKIAHKQEIEVVLDQVRSGHNVGSVFRTSDALRVRKIHLCGYTPTPPNREIQKTALGATDSVEWEHWDSTIDCLNHLRSRQMKIWAIEQTAQSTPIHKLTESCKNVAIVLGNEVKGVSQEVVDFADKCVEIPQFGTKHSLNVSVCTGIVLWDLCLRNGLLE